MTDPDHLNVKRSALRVEGSAASDDAENPWPGLATFTEEQSNLFHGRDEEIRDLARRAERNALTVLFGQSGLGKSSLLQAGVFPRLRAANYWPIYVRLDHGPGAPTPTEQIKAFVRADTVRAGTWTKPGSAKPGDTLWEFFHHRDDRLVGANGKTIVPVLVLDQFEELFTLGAGGGAERARAVAFMSELAELVENRPSEQLVARLEESSAEMEAFDFSRTDYRVVISLREDFLPHLESLKTIMPALMENRMRLARMTGTQALQAVVKPGGALVTEEVARAIVEFVAGARGGSAERLAELDVEPPLLSVICRELNERRRSLGQSQITADLVSGNRREILTDFYERSVGDLPEPVRLFVEDRLLTKSGFRDNLALETALESPGVTQPLLDTLVSRRLVRIEDRLGVQRVELTHDVLAEVIRASRDARQQRLAVEAARAHEQRALADAARRTRRQRWVIGGMAAVIIALCGAGLYGLQARQVAMRQSSRTDTSFANQLLAQGNLSDGLAYLVRAARKDPHNALLGPRLASLIAFHNYPLPEGPRLSLPSKPTELQFSADGRQLSICTEDGTLLFADLESGVQTTLKLPSPPSSRIAPVWSGGYVAFACEDGAVRIVDLDQGRIAHEAPFVERLTGMAFAGSRLGIRLSTGAIVGIDAVTGRLVTMPFKTGDGFYASAYSADRRWAAIRTTAGTIECWDTTTLIRVASFSPDRGAILGVVGTPDEPEILLGSIKGGNSLRLTLWSLRDGRPLADLGDMAGVTSTAITFARSPDDRHCGLLTSGGLQLFNLETRKPVGAPIPNITPGTRIVFTPDSRLFAAYLLSGDFQIYETATGKPVLGPMDPGGAMRGGRYSGQFDAAGRIMLTQSAEGIARLWDLTTGRMLSELPEKDAGRALVRLSDDGTRLAGTTEDGGVRVWRVDRTAAEPLVMRFVQGAEDQDLAFLPTSPTRMVHLSTQQARIFDVSSASDTHRFDFPEPYRMLNRARTLRDDFKVMVVECGQGASARVQAWWLDPVAGVTRRVDLRDAPATSAVQLVFFSPQRDLAAILPADRTQVQVWNLQTGESAFPPLPLGSVLMGSNQLDFLAFSPDGTRLATGDVVGVVKIWDMSNGKLLRELPALRESNSTCVVFDPTGTRLASANAWGEAEIRDVQTGARVGAVVNLGGSINHLSFSPDGRLLLTASGTGSAQVWEAGTGASVGERIRHRGTIRSARFSPDGRRVLTTSHDQTARIWDTRTGQPLSEPYQHENRVFMSYFSPDGRFFFTESNSTRFGSDGASGWFWPAPPDGGDAPVPAWLLDLATICAGKVLTDEGRFAAPDPRAPTPDYVRRTLAGLPADAPYVEWGRWFLADPATRSIAPGFTITPAEVEQLTKAQAPANPVTNP